MMLTLGSLFDGIGGFPLAGVMCGIRPVWSSEIEPFPLKVTAARFPGMIQLGSVTEIDGGAVRPVEIITFGSPCQDLSVAGKQLGIHEGQRSNLFFEAVRIIKEMRAADERIGRTGKHIRPRFAVWENVPGAFSSNKGADFKAVLEALAGVREDGVDVPQPKKWNTGGGIMGNGWSIAWRVYDAQYWGVPQRRKRIYLVADFASERAPEILFERESVRWDSATGGEAGEGTAADAEGSAGGSCIAFKERAGKPGGGKGILPAVGRAFTLATNTDQSVCYAVKGNFIDRDTKQNGCGWRDGEMYTLDATDRHGVAYGIDCRYANYTGGGIAATLDASYYKGPGARNGKEREFLAIENGPVVYPGVGITSPENGNNPQPGDPAPSLTNDSWNYLVEDAQPPRKYIVRRLTPTECARLQGFPDEWCEGLGGSDSAIYKAYGNGLALPCAYDVMQRMARFVEREKEEKQVG